MQLDGPYEIVARPVSRRVRRRIRRVDPWSVLKLSSAIYAAIMLAMLVGGMLLYLIAAASGIVGHMQDFIRVMGWPDAKIRAAQVFRALLLMGIANVVVWSAVTLFLAFLFNLASDWTGGIEITTTEREG